MTTIRDEIEAWARRNIAGATAVTRNTEAYNHLQQAVQELTTAPWASLALGKDMLPITEDEVLSGKSRK